MPERTRLRGTTDLLHAVSFLNPVVDAIDHYLYNDDEDQQVTANRTTGGGVDTSVPGEQLQMGHPSRPCTLRRAYTLPV